MSEQNHREKGSIRPEDQVNPGPVETEPLWTVKEVAEFLRLKPETVRSMARKNEIPTVRINRRWRFRRRDIEQWVQTMSGKSQYQV